MALRAGGGSREERCFVSLSVTALFFPGLHHTSGGGIGMSSRCRCPLLPCAYFCGFSTPSFARAVLSSAKGSGRSSTRQFSTLGPLKSATRPEEQS